MKALSGGGGHEPVLDHGHLRVAGVTLQVVGDQVGAAALLLLQQPVQRLGEDGAGVQPDAAVAVQQFQAQPVRALGHGQLLQVAGQLRHVLRQLRVVEDAQAVTGIQAGPVVKAALYEQRHRVAIPVGPDDAGYGRGDGHGRRRPDVMAAEVGRGALLQAACEGGVEAAHARRQPQLAPGFQFQAAHAWAPCWRAHCSQRRSFQARSTQPLRT